MAQQEFRQPMAGPQQIGANIFAAAEQIARSLFLFGRHVNRRQGAGPIEDGQVCRIATIGLDSIARPTWTECRRNDVTGNRVPLKGSAELEAARSGFVAASHGPVPLQSSDAPQNRRDIRCQRMECRRPLPGQ
jgi:hypothetical protein